jgi:hypothetical protein
VRFPQRALLQTLPLQLETNSNMPLEHAVQQPSKPRQYSETHIDEDCSHLRGRFVNALFFGCTFSRCDGLDLNNCVLEHSKLTATEPQDILGVSLTLNCHTFKNLELTPDAFDLLMLLVCKMKGNTDKRKAILEHVVGRDRAGELLRKMRTLE